MYHRASSKDHLDGFHREELLGRSLNILKYPAFILVMMVAVYI